MGDSSRQYATSSRQPLVTSWIVSFLGSVFPDSVSLRRAPVGVSVIFALARGEAATPKYDERAKWRIVDLVGLPQYAAGIEVSSPQSSG
jgi:hypothetical protein